MSQSTEGVPDRKEQQVNAAYDYYKNLYLDFYGEGAAQDVAYDKNAVKNGLSILKKQYNVGEIMQGDSLLIISLFLGAVGALGAAVNTFSISDLSTDQDSICTAVSLNCEFECMFSNKFVLLKFIIFISILLSFNRSRPWELLTYPLLPLLIQLPVHN